MENRIKNPIAQIILETDGKEQYVFINGSGADITQLLLNTLKQNKQFAKIFAVAGASYTEELIWDDAKKEVIENKLRNMPKDKNLN